MKQQKQKQYTALEQLALSINPSNPAPNGEKIYRALRRLETKLTKLHEKACNTGVSDVMIDKQHKHATIDIETIFGALPVGLYINSDPRGYALKIDDEVFRTDVYKGINLQSDWGGYGLLAPDLTLN